MSLDECHNLIVVELRLFSELRAEEAIEAIVVELLIA